jgi:transposase
LWAAAEARSHGRGGIAAVARASGIAESTIRAGLRELESGESIGTARVRRAGGGRKSITETDPSLLKDSERLVDPESRGDPEQPLRWTAKSVRKLADGLRGLGHEVSHQTVARLLRSRGYSLQANAKTREGTSHPDRDAQFGHINATASAAIAACQPVISVDTKRKELVGDFKNGGRELCPKGSPVAVGTHDFIDKQLGKAIPYGIYDHKIEHRLFSFISQNWRGKPLISHEVIVNLIGGTTTRTGLEVFARLDERSYPKDLKVSNSELAAIRLEGHAFHPEWNYTIKPRLDC